MKLDPIAALTSDQQQRLKRLGRPLGFVFWGGVLVVIDVNIGLRLGGRGVSIDLLPDLLGLGLICLGLIILGAEGRFSGMADLLVTVAASVFFCLFLGSVAALFVPQLAQLERWGLVAIELVAGIAVLAVCRALQLMAAEMGLTSLAKSWRSAGILIVLLFTVPGALLVLVQSPGFIMLNLAGRLVAVVAFFVALNRSRIIANRAVPDTRGLGGTF